MSNGETSTPQAICWGTTPTPVGHLLVAANDQGIVVVEFVDDPSDALPRLRRRLPSAQLQASLTADDPVVTAVSTMVQCGSPAQVPVAPQGTPFQRDVWSALMAIPVGQTRTYSQVANAIGRPRAVRAVASACARNPVAVVVPCHRVIRTDGGLGGYAYGLPIKEHLLAVEQSLAREAA